MDSSDASDCLQFLRCCRASQSICTCSVSGLSVPAISDVELVGDSNSSSSLILTGVVGGLRLRILCDTGATTSFINEKHLSAMKTAGDDIKVTAISDMNIRLVTITSIQRDLESQVLFFWVTISLILPHLYVCHFQPVSMLFLATTGSANIMHGSIQKQIE